MAICKACNSKNAQRRIAAGHPTEYEVWNNAYLDAVKETWTAESAVRNAQANMLDAQRRKEELEKSHYFQIFKKGKVI